MRILRNKKVIISISCIFIIIFGLICYFIFSEKNSKDFKKKDTLNLTEEDISPYITGLDDHYILEGSIDIDYLHDVQIDSEMIKTVEVDDSNVDLSTPGKYTVTYKIHIDTEKYNKKNNTTISNDTIVIEKEIEIVDEETAKDLANKGEIVWTDKSETLPKDDGTVTPTPEPEKPIENAVTPEPTPVPSKPDSKKEENKDDKKNNSSSNSNNSGNSSGSSGNSGNSSSSPSKPAEHKHNWVAQTTTIPHAAEGYYKTVEVEPAVYEYRSICNQCGEDITNNVDMHFADSPNCGGYSNKKIKIKDAVTQQQWVETKKAWTETKVTGYKCSGCGATK